MGKKLLQEINFNSIKKFLYLHKKTIVTLIIVIIGGVAVNLISKHIFNIPSKNNKPTYSKHTENKNSRVFSMENSTNYGETIFGDKNIYNSAPSSIVIDNKKYSMDKENLIKNGGFEEDLEYWGNGMLEIQKFHGGLHRFWVQPGANIRYKIDSDVKKSGLKSLKIISNQPLTPYMYGTACQAITGLIKNTKYMASFWVKAELANEKTLRVTMDFVEWSSNKELEEGTYDWREFRFIFDTKDSNYIEFRILSEEPGTVWIDDISINRLFPEN